MQIQLAEQRSEYTCQLEGNKYHGTVIKQKLTHSVSMAMKTSSTRSSITKKRQDENLELKLESQMAIAKVGRLSTKFAFSFQLKKHTMRV